MNITLRADDKDTFEAVVSVLSAITDIKGVYFHDAEVSCVTKED